MADPLSVVAGVTGVSVACAQIAHSVHTLCDKFRNAPRDVREIGRNMLDLSGILDSLGEILQRGKGSYKHRLLRDTNAITKRLNRVIKQVDKLINRRPSFRGRMTWALFDHTKTEELLRKIEALKSTLTMVLAVVQLALAQSTHDRVANEKLGNILACAIRECRQCIIHGHSMPIHPSHSSNALEDNTRSDRLENLAKKSHPSDHGQDTNSLPINVDETANTRTQGFRAHKAAPLPRFSSSRMPLFQKQMNVTNEAGSQPPLRAAEHSPSQPQSTPKHPEQYSERRTSVDEKAGQPDCSPGHDSSDLSSGSNDDSFTEIAGWLFRLVFESATITHLSTNTIPPDSKIKNSSTPSPEIENSSEAYTPNQANMAHSEYGTDTTHMLLLPSADYMYGLSIRSVVGNLLQTWTYIKLSELPLDLVLKNDEAAQLANVMVVDSNTTAPQNEDGKTSPVDKGPTSPLYANDWYTMDDSDDEDEEWLPLTSSNLPKLLGNAPSCLCIEMPKTASVHNVEEAVCTSDDQNSLPFSRTEPGHTDKPQETIPFTFETMLKRLEQTMNKTSEDRKKAEKSRQQIDTLKKAEQDAKFTRLEVMLMQVEETLKAQQLGYRKALEVTQHNPTQSQAPDKERYSRLEDKLMSQKHEILTLTAEALALKTISAADKAALTSAQSEIARQKLREDDIGWRFQCKMLSQISAIKTHKAEIQTLKNAAVHAKADLIDAAHALEYQKAKGEEHKRGLEGIALAQDRVITDLRAEKQLLLMGAARDKDALARSESRQVSEGARIARLEALLGARLAAVRDRDVNAKTRPGTRRARTAEGEGAAVAP